jgi:AraC-like DNA-binding protein/mannose-6-phosphate isomerase-like protein (cupin superfamily)
VPHQLLRFADHALGRPYHAALVGQPSRGAASELHGHADYFEFMGVLEGSGLHLLPDGTQRLRAGDVVLARPGDRHALQGSPPVGMWFVNIAFPAASWRGFLDLSRISERPGGQIPGAREAIRWEDGGRPPHWRLAPEAATRAEAVFRQALDRFHRQPAMLDVVRFWTDLLELLDLSDRQLPPGVVSDHPSDDPSAALRPPWLSAMHSAMRREENLRAGLPRMLELAAVSPAHLSRSMRRHYATTPTDFLRELRLERAVELLCTTSEPVTRIAERCGFTAQSYFTRCFTAAYDVPPREYRLRAWRAFVPQPEPTHSTSADR